MPDNNIHKNCGGQGEMRYLALLRGVNVGRGNRLAMADLRAAVTACGGADVATVLASGNAVFTAPPGAKPEDLALRLEQALDLRTRVTMVSATTLKAIVGSRPAAFGKADGSRLLVGFPRVPGALTRLRPLAARDWTPATLVLGKQAAWLWCPNGVLADGLAAEVNKVGGEDVTARNWNTVQKLVAALERA